MTAPPAEKPDTKRPAVGLVLLMLVDLMAWLGLFVSVIVLAGEADAAAGGGRLPFVADWFPYLDREPIFGASAGSDHIDPFMGFARIMGLATLVAVIIAGSLVPEHTTRRKLAHIAPLGTIAMLLLAGGLLSFSLARLDHAGVHPDGVEVPSLEVAIERAKTREAERTHQALATELFGGREGTEELESPLEEAAWTALPVRVVDRDLTEDFRPLEPGVIHTSAYFVPAAENRRARMAAELWVERRELEEEDLSEAIAAEREAGARVASPWAASVWGASAFLALHLAGLLLVAIVQALGALLRRKPLRPTTVAGWAVAAGWIAAMAFACALIIPR